MNFNLNKKMISEKSEKPRDAKNIIKRLWRYLIHYKWLLLLALFLALIANVFALIGPFLSGEAINVIAEGINGNMDFNRIIFYVIIMIVLYLISAILSYILSVIMIKMSQSVVYKMRQDVFNKLINLPISYFDKNQTGDILSKISYDIDTINTSLSSDVITIFTSSITIIVALVMMFIISPLLILVFAITIPISMIYTRYMAKKTRPLFSKRSASLGRLNGFVEEKFTGNKTIKAYNREEFINQKFHDVNNYAVKSAYQAEYYGSISGPSVNFINNISLSLVSVFGALLHFFTGMTIGSISSFVLYSRKFSGPINEISNIVAELQSALAAAERVLNLIDEKPEIDDENPYYPKTVKGNIMLENVFFGYLKNQIIIDNFSLNVSNGKTIAIVGPTGAGKTTLINLLMRFYDIDRGNINLDKISIKKYKRSDLRNAYAMVLQDTWLFNGTIYDNIIYGSKDVGLERVKEVCKIAKIDHFIEQLPNGYQTILSDDGINISKGQKQLLTIARAMLMNAKMLILDEATSNVDTQTEIAIQKAMLELMQNKTCFVIAHRLSTIQNADLIIVFNEGKIIEKGNHQDLLNAKGFYYEMYNSQF